MTKVSIERKAFVYKLFSSGLPRLWCPLLTHYQDDLELDEKRISAHIRSIRPWIPAFLVPGSTGDGWELSSRETDTLLDLLLVEAVRQDFSLMIGVLRTGQGEALEAIQNFLARFTNGDPSVEVLSARRICGFTVTPPKGAELSQEVILKELETIAATGIPLAIYQLPQITDNEMSPATVVSLASRYPNLYLFKDTSGHDQVAFSTMDLGNLFMVRGAEGDYSRWFKANDGQYDGFLLSTANCFARELSKVMDLISDGRVEEAEALSNRISKVVLGVFSKAAGLPFGNPFANANKAMDHILAWGLEYRSAPLPMTHSGNRLPVSLIETAFELLDQNGFTITKGYME